MLFLQNGRWNDLQIIPAEWIKESTAKYSDVNSSFGYGYMWWTAERGAYLASGTGGQKLFVDPERNLVVVNRVDTGEGLRRGLWFDFGPRVNNTAFFDLVERIYSAKN